MSSRSHLPDPLVIGTPLVDVATGESFTVLCSCPNSRPVHHTKRFIEAHPGRYRLPTEAEYLARLAPQPQGE